MKRIYLLGFMGCGKSYQARRLALAWGLPAADLDEWVEQGSGRRISELFEQRGEAGFRELESRYLRKSKTIDSLVLATGGGTPVYHGNMDWMNAHGLTVYLQASPDILWQRLHNQVAQRPLLSESDDPRATLQKLLEARRPIYEKAQLCIDVDNPDTDVARLIEQYLIKQLDD